MTTQVTKTLYASNAHLIAWLQTKADQTDTHFNVHDWIVDLADTIAKDTNGDEESVIKAVEQQLLSAMIDGHRTGNWPWKNT
jgi:hypothetical protein